MWVIIARNRGNPTVQAVIGPFVDEASAASVIEVARKAGTDQLLAMSHLMEAGEWNGEGWQKAPGQIAHRVAKWNSVRKAT